MSTTTRPVQQRDAMVLGQFTDVDAGGDAERMIAFLEAIESQPTAAALRLRSYELLQVMPKQRVVDVGCGTGMAVAELRGRGIDAIGIDRSEAMIKRARQRFPDARFQVAPAEVLPIQDASLHGYRAERVYSHMTDARPALAEARRVLAPGGRFVLVDIDNDLWIIDSDDRPLTRTLVRAYADSVANAWIGRNCRSLLLDMGFVEVSVELQPAVQTRLSPSLVEGVTRAALTAGLVSAEQAATWVAEQRRRDEQGRFFAANPRFVVSAVRD
jgi:SAM-dependent methyltransferase